MWQKVPVIRILELVMKASLGLFLYLLPIFVAAETVVPIDSVLNHVNIRMSADAKSEVVGKLQQGDSLLLVQSVTDWHEVKIDGGATGFISADWTKVLGEASTVEEQPAVQAELVEEADTADNSPEVVAEEGSSGAAVEDVVDSAEQQFSDSAVKELVESAEQADADSHESIVAEVDDTIEIESDEEVVAKTENTESAQDVAEASVAVVETAEDSNDVADSEVAERVAAEDLQEAGSETNDVVIPTVLPVAVGATGGAGLQGSRGEKGPIGDKGPAGEVGPPGPQGAGGAGSIEGSVDFLVKFAAPTIGESSQIYDNGNNVGIGTTEPKQRLEVNGNIQIHERNSSVAGLMITQSSGETGYIMHNMASTLTIGAGSIDRITINRDGNVGIGMARPSHPIEMASGAYVSAGGVWTNSSSRERKENIVDLTPEEAIAALAQLQPVEFNYKNDQQEKYVGFIAEDVPDLVATSDRQSLSTMDIVAVLTTVVQEQQKKIAELEARLEQQ
jgi:hypothetical protein